MEASIRSKETLQAGARGGAVCNGIRSRAGKDVHAERLKMATEDELARLMRRRDAVDAARRRRGGERCAGCGARAASAARDAALARAGHAAAAAPRRCRRGPRGVSSAVVGKPPAAVRGVVVASLTATRPALSRDAPAVVAVRGEPPLTLPSIDPDAVV